LHDLSRQAGSIHKNAATFGQLVKAVFPKMLNFALKAVFSVFLISIHLSVAGHLKARDSLLAG